MYPCIATTTSLITMRKLGLDSCTQIMLLLWGFSVLSKDTKTCGQEKLEIKSPILGFTDYPTNYDRASLLLLECSLALVLKYPSILVHGIVNQRHTYRYGGIIETDFAYSRVVEL